MTYSSYFKWFLYTACLATFSFSVSAQMYKQTDKDGNVTYTDTPDQSDAKPITPPPASTFSPPSAAPISPTNLDSSEGEGEQAQTERSVVKYSSISIVSPENGGAVRANGGSFAVQLAVEPSLDVASKHKIAVLMDGAVKAEGQSTTFTLQGIDRGEHSFSAQILSDDGSVLLTSSKITFTVLRVSAR